MDDCCCTVVSATIPYVLWLPVRGEFSVKNRLKLLPDLQLQLEKEKILEKKKKKIRISHVNSKRVRFARRYVMNEYSVPKIRKKKKVFLNIYKIQFYVDLWSRNARNFDRISGLVSRLK